MGVGKVALRKPGENFLVLSVVAMKEEADWSALGEQSVDLNLQSCISDDILVFVWV